MACWFSTTPRLRTPRASSIATTETKLIIEGAAAQLEIDGTFSADDPGTFTQIASDILHLRVEERHGNTVLTR